MAKKDISILLTCFLMKVVGIWFPTNKTEERRYNIALIYTVSTFTLGLYVDVADLYNTWGDFANWAYTTCNLLCIIMVITKTFILLINKAELGTLVLDAQKHFWHLNYDPKEKAFLLQCQQLCMLISAGSYFFPQCICAFYVLTPLMENLERNHSDRVLPFTMWVSWPVMETPYYEIMFAVQILALQQIGLCYVSYDNFLIVLNLHTSCQFRILQHRMMNLNNRFNRQTNMVDYTNKCYVNLKNCIRKHQALINYCERVDSVFTIMVLGHIVIISLLMCLVCYQIILAESSSTRRLVFVFTLIGSLLQLILFTYSCDSVIRESSNIGMAIYSGPWVSLPTNETGKKLRQDLTTVIIRSRNPCALSAGGFFPVSLETSTSVISTAMSYFTLMRESSAKIEK